MFRFVTIIPLEFWAIVLLLLFMWAAFGVNGLIISNHPAKTAGVLIA
jgi:hypothetical protein